MNEQKPDEHVEKVKKQLLGFPEIDFTELAKLLPPSFLLGFLLFALIFVFIPNIGLPNEEKSQLSLITISGAIVCAFFSIISYAILPILGMFQPKAGTNPEKLEPANTPKNEKVAPQNSLPIVQQGNKTNLEKVGTMNLLTKEEIPVFAAVLARSGLVNKGIKRENFCELIVYEATDDQLKASNEDFSKNLIPDLDKKWRRKSLIVTGNNSMSECDRIEADISEYERTTITNAVQRLELEQAK